MRDAQNNGGHLFLTREDELKLPPAERDALAMVVSGDSLACICTLIQNEGRTNVRPLALDLLWQVNITNFPAFLLCDAVLLEGVFFKVLILAHNCPKCLCSLSCFGPRHRFGHMHVTPTCICGDGIWDQLSTRLWIRCGFIQDSPVCGEHYKRASIKATELYNLGVLSAVLSLSPVEGTFCPSTTE